MSTLSNSKHTLELSTLDLRNIAQGLREAGFEAICADRYIPAVTYLQFAAHLAVLAGRPDLAQRDLQRAQDAECAMRLAAIQAAEDAALDLDGEG